MTSIPEILNNVYNAGYDVAGLHAVGEGSGTITSDALHQAQEAIAKELMGCLPEKDNRAFPGLGGPLTDSPVRETCYKQGRNEALDEVRARLTAFIGKEK